MCFGGSPKVDTSAQTQQQADAALARIREDARQQRIDFGRGVIDAVFDGGTFTPTFTQEVPEVIQDENGVRLSVAGPHPDIAFPGRGSLNQFVNRYIDTDLFDPRITPTGPEQTSEGFEPLIADRRQAQLDFFTPQIDRQFDDASDNLAFALARGGLSSSTTAADRQGDLSRNFQLQDAQIRSNIDADISGFRDSIQRTRESLTNQLFATGDADLATNQALARSRQLSLETPQLSVLPQLFASAAAGIGGAAQARRSAELDQLVSDLTPSLSFRDSGRNVT